MNFLSPAYPPASFAPAAGPAVWLLFAGNELVVNLGSGGPSYPQGSAAAPPLPCSGEPLFLGLQDGAAVMACEIPRDTPLPDGYDFMHLRTLLALLPEREGALTGYASQLLYWRRTSGFCPVCGLPAAWKGGDWGRICAGCGHVAYPHISPAVLVLVYDGPRILLVHKPEWPAAMRSIVAGFVEPNETLEDCVRREVREEVGVEITDILYQGSQGWPFPHQLMVGFTARYAGGILALDTAELDDAAWYSATDLPELPSTISLSRKLIDCWQKSAD